MYLFEKKYFLERNHASVFGVFTEFGGKFLPSLAEILPTDEHGCARKQVHKSKYVNTSKNPVYCFLRYPFGKGSEEAIKTRERMI